MVCPNCGMEIDPSKGGRFCPNCGSSIEAASAAEPVVEKNAEEIPAAAVGVIPDPAAELTRREVLLCVPKGAKSNIVFAAVVCFISAALMICLNLIPDTLSAGIIIEEAVVVLLGILLLTTRRVWVAVLLLIYGIVNTAIYFAATGTAGGWLLIVAGILAGILAIIGTSKCAKAWKTYKKQHRSAEQ